MKSCIIELKLIILTLICLVGCDGHVRLLYLSEKPDASVPRSLNSRIIHISDSPGVSKTIATIAENNGLIQKDINRWMKDDFTLRVIQESPEVWRVEMLDWPSASRSKQSKQIEEQIVAQLKRCAQSHEQSKC